MAEANSETVQAKQYRRHESIKEYRQVATVEKGQKGAGREHKRQAAIKAISKDNPGVAERKDLENLAALPDTNQSETVADQALNRQISEAGNDPNGESGDGEAKKIYKDPKSDPVIGAIEKRILRITNSDERYKKAVEAGGGGASFAWRSANFNASRRQWDSFVRDYPEKARAYADKNADIKAALEQLEESEGRETTKNNVADSIRTSENSPTEPGENDVSNPATEDEGANAETKLLSVETAGVQATLLLGGEIPAEIDRVKIEAIAKGEKPNTEKANKASIGERVEYWSGENSPYKNMTFNQKLERWRGTMKRFLDQYKGKPEAEFFERMGIDLENDDAAAEIYDFYFAQGKGDVGLFAARIAENNSAEQIQENKTIIQYLGKMYGDKSAKVAEHLLIGMKNAQIDVDSFVKSAEENIKKGKEMPGSELIEFINQNIIKQETTPQAKKREFNWPIIRKTTEQANGQEFRRLEIRPLYRADKWTEKMKGALDIEEDALNFTPQKGALARSVDLADTGPDGSIKFTPMFWKILETNPDSVSGEWPDRYISLRDADYAVRSAHAVDAKTAKVGRDWQGPDNGFILMWNKLVVDKKTLAEMQQRIIGYLEEQSSKGRFDSGLVEAAKAVLKSHKSPEIVGRFWPQNNPGGQNIENPKTHVSFFGLIDDWSNGEITQKNGELSYANEKILGKDKKRTIKFVTEDPVNPEKKILTKEAWELIFTIPEDAPLSKPWKKDREWRRPSLKVHSLTSPERDRKGVWKRYARNVSVGAEGLSRMQGLIRSYVDEEVRKGLMDESTPLAIDGITKYKHKVLKPARYVTFGDETLLGFRDRDELDYWPVRKFRY